MGLVFHFHRHAPIFPFEMIDSRKTNVRYPGYAQSVCYNCSVHGLCYDKLRSHHLFKHLLGLFHWADELPTQLLRHFLMVIKLLTSSMGHKRNNFMTSNQRQLHSGQQYCAISDGQIGIQSQTLRCQWPTNADKFIR